MDNAKVTDRGRSSQQVVENKIYLSALDSLLESFLID